MGGSLAAPRLRDTLFERRTGDTAAPVLETLLTAALPPVRRPRLGL